MKKELAVLLSATTLCAPALAASDPGSNRFERRYDTTLSYRLPPGADNVRGSVTLDLKMLAKVWTLMGEPVVYCSVSWKLRSANVEVKRRGQWHLLMTQEMPPKTWEAVDLVQATIGFPIGRVNQSFRQTALAYVPCDIGASSANGDPRGSFNVPGSPNWNRLLLQPGVPYEHLKDWDKPENYLSAAEAKAMLKSANHELRPLEPGRTESEMGLLFEFNFWPWIGWLDAQDAKKESERLAERAKTRKRVGDSLDPFDAMVQEVETTTAQRSAQADSSASDGARRQTAEQLERRRRTLAQKGCLSAAEALADFDAAAARAETGHEKCGTGIGVVAFRDDKTRLYGYKRPDGSVLIEARFDRAENFSEGLGLVRGGECGETYCYVNAGGAAVLKPGATRAGSFSNGLALVFDKEKSKYGYIDHEGRFVIPPRYDRADNFQNGSAKVSTFLRSEGPEDRCKRGWSYYAVGQISTTGQFVSGPSEESESYVRSICLTRSN